MSGDGPKQTGVLDASVRRHVYDHVMTRGTIPTAAKSAGALGC